MSVSSSWARDQRVRRVMVGNKSRDTLPELAIRRELHRRGYRFRVNFRPVPDVRTTADIVFPRQRVAIFIDGCFWHGCPTHYKRSKTNVDYWDAKIATNRERDERQSAQLAAAGWRVVRFWAHVDVLECCSSLADILEPKIKKSM